MRLMNDEAKRDSPRMRWLADRYVRPMSEVVRAHVERAQAEGLMVSVPPASLHYLILGAAGLIFSQAPECKYITGVDPTEPEFAERHADALIALLIGAGKRPPLVQPARKRFTSKSLQRGRRRA